jgi:hypothetical protein
MIALIGGSPQLARMLRPLCRMLGFDPVPLRLPPRAPKPTALNTASPVEHRWGFYHWKCAKPPALGLIIGEKRNRGPALARPLRYCFVSGMNCQETSSVSRIPNTPARQAGRPPG